MRRFLLGALLAVGGVLVTPTTAWAHAELTFSSPGYGDRLRSGPGDVRLVFSGPVDLTGARLTLERRGARTEALKDPAWGSADRREVLIPLPRLADGAYRLVWFFLGSDGHLMGGEVPFDIGVPAPGPATPTPTARAAAPSKTAVQVLDPGVAGPPVQFDLPEAASASGPERPRFTIAVATPQSVVRFVDYVSLAILIGGTFFVARVWTEGSRDRRVLQLLWWALLTSAVTTLLTFGLTAAGLRGVGALQALSPSVMSGVLGTRYSEVMVARAVFLSLGFAALALLTLGREQAVRSLWWRVLSGGAAAGVLGTRALLGHVSNEGIAARLAVFVHLAGVAVWLGGLVMLVTVVLPRRRSEEVRVLLPRFSSLAFTAVSAMVLAGGVMMLRVVPDLSDLPRSGYGRMLILKLAMVVLLLVAAQQARTFTERRLVRDATRLRPLLTAVAVELSLAVVILSSTAVLAGRRLPTESPNRVATSGATAGIQPSSQKGP